VIKEPQKIRDNKNKPKQQGRPNKIVRVAPNSKPQNSLTPQKTYSQILSDIPIEVEQPTSTESMLVQIMQMLKEQDKENRNSHRTTLNIKHPYIAATTIRKIQHKKQPTNLRSKIATNI
jgi:hypothetical protein